MWIDWADKLADEMMARANGSNERLDALRHDLAEALRAEREACAALCDDGVDWHPEPAAPTPRYVKESCAKLARDIRARSTPTQ